jgi:hypothetical protein
MVQCPDMKDDIFYEPVGEASYQRTVTALERELARLKAELLPVAPASPTEQDKQHRVWVELDRVCKYLEQIRDKAIKTVRLG